MSSAVLVAKEATHGTVGTSFVTVPCQFKASNKQKNKVLDEDRNGQDANFSMVKGTRYEEFSVADSAIYHDTIGIWLMSALGTPTKTVVAAETVVWDNVFKNADDPESWSLKWTQPRRETQAYQALYGVVDKLTIKFAADGDLSYNLSGVAMGESEVASPAFSYSSVVPFSAWAGTVTIGGSASADLVSGSIALSRARKPFFTIANTQDPAKMSIGKRMVEFELVLDFVTKGDYDDFKNSVTQDINILWEDADTTLGTAAHPQFKIDLPKVGYEEGEIDTDPDLPMVKIKGKGMYDGTALSSLVVTVRSTTDYTV